MWIACEISSLVWWDFGPLRFVLTSRCMESDVQGKSWNHLPHTIKQHLNAQNEIDQVINHAARKVHVRDIGIAAHTPSSNFTSTVRYFLSFPLLMNTLYSIMNLTCFEFPFGFLQCQAASLNMHENCQTVASQGARISLAWSHHHPPRLPCSNNRGGRGL